MAALIIAAIDSSAQENELLKALRWSDVDLDDGLVPHQSGRRAE